MGGKESAEERITRIFNALDVNDNGAIILNEIPHILTDSAEKLGLSDEQTRLLLEKADKNHDGVLDYNEFSQMLTSRDAQRNKLRKALYLVADTVIAKTDRPKVHSYIDEYNCIPPPLFILGISLIQIAVFVFYMHGHPENPFTYCAGCWVDGTIGPLPFAPPLRFEAWRFESYQFVHQGLMHLLPNVTVQLLLGVPLELVHKMWRIAPIYLLAVSLGALLQYVLDPSVYLIGCSAGVYALIGAHLSNVIINWSEMPFRLFRLTVIVVFVLYETGSALYRRLQTDKCDRISYTAHIAGAVTGILLGIVILHNLKVLYWERILMVASLLVYATIFAFLIAMVVFVKPFSQPLWNTVHCQEDASLLDINVYYREINDY